MKEKTVIGSIFTVFSYLVGCINEAIIILAILIVMDYIFGILASYKEGKKFDKDLAFWGLIKKLGYVGVLLLSFLLDYMIVNGLQGLAIKMPTNTVFGLISIVYIFGTEGLSLLKHWAVLGVNFPPKMQQFLGVMQAQGDADQGGGSDA